MKKNIIVISLILILMLFIGEKKAYQEIQVRTDIESIYNHFPDFPRTEIVEWCAISSTGIGPTTIEIYVFAFYDYDVEQLLETNLEEKISFINPPFFPDTLNRQYEGWNKVNGAFLFQNKINKYKRMYTDVYVNTDCNIIYMEAIGD